MIVILNNIRSLHNVGSIFRTADGAGVEKLYLCGITPSPLDAFGRVRPEVAKVALGAEHTVAWEKIFSATALIRRLKKEGYILYAVEQARNSVPYNRVSPRVSRLALVLGAEVDGLSSALLRLCDKVLEIPMRGALVRHARHPRNAVGKIRRKESLNVSVAAGIVMYELVQEKNKKRE